MPKLSFAQLLTIFVAGFFGYVVLLVLFSIGLAVIYPSYIKGTLNRSLDNFFKEIFIFFGIFGVVATLAMLPGAWCFLRIVNRRKNQNIVNITNKDLNYD